MKKLTYSDFLKVCNQIKNAEITSKACLGYSSNSIYLNGTSRVNEVSIRNHSGMYSMLITNESGMFYFNGGVANIKHCSSKKAASIAYQVYKHFANDIHNLPL